MSKSFLISIFLKKRYSLNERGLISKSKCLPARIVEYSEFLNGEKGRGYPLAFDIKDGLLKAYDISEEYMEVSFIPGTALFANSEKLQNNLYFREDFFMYHEDVELSLRILTQTDLKLYFLNTAIVAHDSKQSFSRISTCRLALRNLFTCLVTYQNSQEFLNNYGAYGKNLFRMYRDFYYQYYPFVYFIFGIFYLTTSIFRLQRQKNSNLSRLYDINQRMSGREKQFEFIF